MTLKETVKHAMEQDNTLLVTLQQLNDPEFKHSGFSTEYMQFLGFTKAQLRKLESRGLALRSYTKNIWREGEKTPSGKEVKKGTYMTGKGHKLRWLLLVAERSNNVNK